MTSEEFQNLPFGTEVWTYKITLDEDGLSGDLIYGTVVVVSGGIRWIQDSNNHKLPVADCYKTKEEAAKQLIWVLGDIEMSAMRQAEKLMKELREQS